MSDDLQHSLVKFFESNKDICEGLMDGWGFYTERIPSGVSSKRRASHGGKNGGSEYWTVWEFSRGDEKVYMKFFGYYAHRYPVCEAKTPAFMPGMKRA